METGLKTYAFKINDDPDDDIPFLPPPPFYFSTDAEQ
jgi:hypothetical protein